ncbi:hypothetical protein OSTOST_21115, partial [Ostertagia ostertagi]
MNYLIQWNNFSDSLRTQEFQRYDGWYNNRGNPKWGSVGSQLLRDSPANYADGIYTMNLLAHHSFSSLSPNLFCKGSPGIRNRRNLTAMFAFFCEFRFTAIRFAI